LFNFTLADVLNATVTARVYLENTGNFLFEEATALEADGDAAIAHVWKMAGGAIKFVLQVSQPSPYPHPPPPSPALQSEPVLLFDAIAPVLLAFPDLTLAPTLCDKAQAIIAAFSGKTLLIPFPNPRYSPSAAATQPRYKLSPLHLGSDPIFNLIASAVASCSLTSELPRCDAAKAIVQVPQT